MGGLTGGGGEAGAGLAAATLTLTSSASPLLTAAAALLPESPPGSPRHAVRTGLLSPTAMARRGGGGSRAGGERAGARRGGARARDRPEPRPFAAALPLDAGPAGKGRRDKESEGPSHVSET